MTLPERIKFIREERFQDLNDWERDFIQDIYDSMTAAGEVTEEEVKEFFTRRQVEKVNEIWENLGL